ncbi:spore germination protein [Brevibacillus daliensis]|uniref:spore germination protein n=1 Tax=Brevibacillus daliensis TaxID=2892995 RepID=UPI001E5190E5|nr:spore germination protein [Brevibacillus daliensis]
MNGRKWLIKNKNKALKEPVHEKAVSSISRDLQINEKELYSLFDEAPDLKVHHIKLNGETNAILTYLEGLTDKKTIQSNILKPLMTKMKSIDQLWSSNVIYSHIICTLSWTEIEAALLEGNCILFVNGEEKAIIIDSQGWPQRSVEEPHSETMLKANHEGFLETASQNIALIRRFLPNRELKIKQYKIGERAKTNIYLIYLRDVTNPIIIEELEQRINSFTVDTLLTTGELEQYIEDATFSPFPQSILTERPDATAMHILEGRVAIIVDRSPRVLITPVNFLTFFQTIDDYSLRWYLAIFVRLLRLLSFFIAVFLPALYIVVIAFHYEVLPMKLILSISESREHVPVSPFLEAILMESTLELLREAGIRLPSNIGQTVSIVGGIVIGQAAVQAGLVSNIMVIVVSLTAIASFIVPVFDMAYSIRLVRFPMMILGWMFGMVGIAMGFMIILAHLVTMESMGTSYGTPLSPMKYSDWKDSVIRSPLRNLKRRQSGPRPIQRNKK